jgi:rare lipoprotein A
LIVVSQKMYMNHKKSARLISGLTICSLALSVSGVAQATSDNQAETSKSLTSNTLIIDKVSGDVLSNNSLTATNLSHPSALTFTSSLPAVFSSNSSQKTAQSESLPQTRLIANRGGSMVGMASFYSQGDAGGTITATGKRFNHNAMTAAHRTLPFGTRVRVTNLRNGRSVVVTINDRGPYTGGRIIDLSRGAARVIGMINSGVARVRLEVLGK